MRAKRLNKIVYALPLCEVLADVGCDHGYVGIEALKRNICREVIFVDISAASLQKARLNCNGDLKTRAKFVCRNGLGDIRCDAAVIAGMGGLEIMSVLNGAEVLPKTLVLQPMRNQKDLRIYIAERYEIVADEKFFDGKFYDLIVAKKNGCGERLTEEQAVFGKSNLANPSKDFLLFLQNEIDKYNTILQRCNDAEVSEKLQDVRRVYAQVTEEQK